LKSHLISQKREHFEYTVKIENQNSKKNCNIKQVGKQVGEGGWCQKTSNKKWHALWLMALKSLVLQALNYGIQKYATQSEKTLPWLVFEDWNTARDVWKTNLTTLRRHLQSSIYIDRMFEIMNVEFDTPQDISFDTLWSMT